MSTDQRRNVFKFIFGNSATFNSLLVGFFFIASSIGIINHEMWRDELQAWLIARDSTSIVDLFRNLRYEGHPALWHLGLYFLNKFTPNPIAMQLYHLLIATTTIFIFVRFSPFTRLQKILFCFGYFPFYEYSIISRNYALGVLFIFLFCTFYPQKFNRTNIFMILATLFLLANTNFYAAIISVAMLVILLLELLDRKNNNQSISFQTKKFVLISFGICFLVILGAIFTIIPASDMVSGLGIKTQFEYYPFLYSLKAIWRSYVPIPYLPLNLNWWNTNILEYATLESTAIYSLLLIILFSFILSKNSKVLILYSLGTGVIISFDYLKYAGQTRHHGHLFILLIACIWISNNESNDYSILLNNTFKVPKKKILKAIILINRSQKQLITIFLIIHFIAGGYAYIKDLTQPFSKSQDTALYIKKLPFYGNSVLAGYKSTSASPLGALLNKKIYYLQNDYYGSFVIWKRDYLEKLNSEDIIDKLQKLASQENRKIILSLDYELESDIIKKAKSRLIILELSKFQESIAGENYFVYLIEKKLER